MTARRRAAAVLPRAACAAAAAGLLLAAATAARAGPTIEHRRAVLQGLDKVTARVSPVTVPIGEKARFGTLEILARTCLETPPTEPPESAAFLEIRELPPAEEPVDLFAGWMFASSPALSGLEHPVYDLWVVDCDEPVEPPAEGDGATTPGASVPGRQG
ncbi:MAG TPA: DUF2155 domain-containing protein [Geminicoccaceae bacterium]|nr:DUF2155 domain-containing protein [Geminicoccaceae bacterium]